MKRLFFGIVLCNVLACNNGSSIEKTTDSTLQVIDSQKLITRDSVAYKADSNKRIIDSTFKVLKDSMNSVR